MLMIYDIPVLVHDKALQLSKFRDVSLFMWQFTILNLLFFFNKKVLNVCFYLCVPKKIKLLYGF